MQSTPLIYVIVPNWNGLDSLRYCLDSLLAQTIPANIILVDNGSNDGSVNFVTKCYQNVEIIKHVRNLGYAGGVNPGFRRAIEMDAAYVAPFNNDAIADKRWLESLVTHLEEQPKVGIVACKLLGSTGKNIDSTGEGYSNWGLPFPRGRDEADIDAYGEQTLIFGASGGASLYRVSMLKQIGLLDEDFFAYYEDVDLSFRAQLAGWKINYESSATARHAIGSTGGKIKGFYTYQTMKNLPLLAFKNVPRKYLWRVTWRLTLARALFMARAISRGQLWPAIKGDAMATYLIIKKWGERKRIQKSKTVSDEYIWSIMTHDLPPNAHALRSLRAKWWKLRGKKV